MVAAAQDIAPLPPVADPARRRRADGDFRFFCEQYFPHLFTLAWSDDHLRVIAAVERVVRQRQTLAIAMPRGSGKTTLCLTAVQWALLSGSHEFVYLIASMQEAAVTLLANLKSHLAGNGLLLEDYPEAVHPIRRLEGETRRCVGQRYYGRPTRIGWGNEDIVLATIPASRCGGAIVRVAGLTGNIRGALHVRADGSQVRPSLVICDDPQTDASARSPLQTAERLNILLGALKGLAGPGQRTAILVPCTVIQQGDLADQLLDRGRNPAWQGERTKLVYSFPRATKLWAQYAELRAEALRRGAAGGDETAFYAARREKMDAGAKVAWPQRYLAAHGEISAVQHAMNLRADLGDEAFFAEYQNDPISPADPAGEALTAEAVCAKASGRPRGAVPPDCTRLTMFVDPHDRLLYWAVCAWEEDFAAGHVVDYGTFPQQPRAFFSLASATRTLGRALPGRGTDGAIQAGLEKLVSASLAREFGRGAGLARLDRLGVDVGYKPGIVAAVQHKVGSSVMVGCKGLGIRAAHQPMAARRRKPGEQHGHHWYMPNVLRTGEFPYLASDVNYWKAFLHGGLATAAGDRGAITLFGRGDEHELLARHVAASEQFVEVHAQGRTVREWSPRPGRFDNHWLDCLVGCAVLAAHAGIRHPDQTAKPPRRKRYTQDDLKRR
jgi:hypothetical protein